MPTTIIALLQAEPEVNHNWLTTYNRGLKKILGNHAQINLFVDLWSNWSIERMHRLLEDKKADWILLGDSYFPHLDELFTLSNRVKIAAHVHTLPHSPFEPYLFKNRGYIGTDDKLSKFDLLFFNSAHQRDCAVNLDHKKCVVTGFPINVEDINKFRNTQKNPNLVVFNQRLSLEKQPTIIALVAQKLVKVGYEVHLLRGKAEDYDGAIDTYEFVLSGSGVKIFTEDRKDAYYSRLSAASTLIHASAFDSFSVGAAEGAILGLGLVLPRTLCYPEIFPWASFYEPYNVEDIVNATISLQQAKIDPPAYEKFISWGTAAVFNKYAEHLLKNT